VVDKSRDSSPFRSREHAPPSRRKLSFRGASASAAFYGTSSEESAPLWHRESPELPLFWPVVLLSGMRKPGPALPRSPSQARFCQKKMLKTQNLKSKGLTKRDLKEISERSQDGSEINLKRSQANLGRSHRSLEISSGIWLHILTNHSINLSLGPTKGRQAAQFPAKKFTKFTEPLLS
jgi:hypothetical protein